MLLITIKEARNNLNSLQERVSIYRTHTISTPRSFLSGQLLTRLYTCNIQYKDAYSHVPIVC